MATPTPIDVIPARDTAPLFLQQEEDWASVPGGNTTSLLQEHANQDPSILAGEEQGQPEPEPESESEPESELVRDGSDLGTINTADTNLEEFAGEDLNHMIWDEGIGFESDEESTTSLESNYENYYADRYICSIEYEKERYQKLHEVMNKVLDNKLFLAPIDTKETHRVLDVGTGGGKWAIDLADRYDRFEIVGRDLTRQQPCWCPPKVRFELDDVELPWTDKKGFDFIRVGNMVGSIRDWEHLMKQIFSHLNPGGFVEFQEVENEFSLSNGGALSKENALTRLLDARVKLHKDLGCSLEPSLKEDPSLKNWAKAAGFINIMQDRRPIPVGKWKEKEEVMGYLFCKFFEDGLDGLTWPLVEYGSFTIPEKVMLDYEVRQALKQPGVVTNLVVTVGQKPEET